MSRVGWLDGMPWRDSRCLPPAFAAPPSKSPRCRPPAWAVGAKGDESPDPVAVTLSQGATTALMPKKGDAAAGPLAGALVSRATPNTVSMKAGPSPSGLLGHVRPAPSVAPDYAWTDRAGSCCARAAACRWCCAVDATEVTFRAVPSLAPTSQRGRAERDEPEFPGRGRPRLYRPHEHTPPSARCPPLPQTRRTVKVTVELGRSPEALSQGDRPTASLLGLQPGLTQHESRDGAACGLQSARAMNASGGQGLVACATSTQWSSRPRGLILLCHKSSFALALPQQGH
jgi:hypothetical protein